MSNPSTSPPPSPNIRLVACTGWKHSTIAETARTGRQPRMERLSRCFGSGTEKCRHLVLPQTAPTLARHRRDYDTSSKRLHEIRFETCIDEDTVAHALSTGWSSAPTWPPRHAVSGGSFWPLEPVMVCPYNLSPTALLHKSPPAVGKGSSVSSSVATPRLPQTHQPKLRNEIRTIHSVRHGFRRGTRQEKRSRRAAEPRRGQPRD